MKTIRQAIRVSRDDASKVVDCSRAAFFWDDVYGIEDDDGNLWAHPKEMVWVRTRFDCFYIEGNYAAVEAEWLAFNAQPSNTLLFSRH